MMNPMIDPHRTEGDDLEFIELVQSAVGGILASGHPEKLYLIHINNWFDHKWLGFEGMHHGDDEHLVVPPFRPNRILAEQAWAHDPVSGSYQPCSAVGIHLLTTGTHRRFSAIAPGGPLVWYTGNTNANQRGAIMAYIPKNGGYRTWYVGLHCVHKWAVLNVKGTTTEEFHGLLTGSEGFA
jgi:hypothetical protein